MENKKFCDICKKNYNLNYFSSHKKNQLHKKNSKSIIIKDKVFLTNDNIDNLLDSLNNILMEVREIKLLTNNN